MDFLDPASSKRHRRRLLVGYLFIAVAIILATQIFLYMAYRGLGLNGQGQVVQYGIVFVSSHPSGATIYLNDKQNNQTSARLQLVSGNYNLRLSRTGYYDWSRQIDVEGASVARYDYPFLIPKDLVTTQLASTETNFGIATQSPDRRWLLVQRGSDAMSFDEYDLKNPKVAPVPVTMPTTVVTAGTGESWQALEWSTDNVHVLLQHTVNGKNEFIMFDRTDPTQSVNLNTLLKVDPTKITLRDKKPDQYFVYDAASQLLQTASIGNPTPVPYLEHVLSYQSYGSDIVLYASSVSTAKDKVQINLFQNNKTYTLRQVPPNTNYLLNLTQYDGTWVVALGASSENKVYVYRNPVSQLNSRLGLLVPAYVLKASNPSYLAFSSNAQFIMAEGGSQFSVYDAEYDKGYTYDTGLPVDSPQPHANWMDDHRLMYISGGNLHEFDYDGANAHTLTAANPSYLPFFDPNEKFVDAVAGAKDDPAHSVLTSTALLTPQDQ